jgi:hypothetical protein
VSKGVRGLVHSLLELAHAALDLRKSLALHGSRPGRNCGDGRRGAAHKSDVAQSQRDHQRRTHDQESGDRCVGGHDPSDTVQHREESSQQQTVANYGKLIGADQRHCHRERREHDQDHTRASAPRLSRFRRSVDELASLAINLLNPILIRSRQLTRRPRVPDRCFAAAELSDLVFKLLRRSVKRVHADTDERRQHETQKKGKDRSQPRIPSRLCHWASWFRCSTSTWRTPRSPIVQSPICCVALSNVNTRQAFGLPGRVDSVTAPLMNSVMTAAQNTAT